jgi:CubicO group peptidase (beta-lactamase class C family)
MGAESDATWSVDSTGLEFCCVGFGATLRDWARLGQLVAQRGFMNGQQVVSEDWIAEISSWGPDDQSGLWSKGKHANSTMLLEQGMLGVGYKGFFWHHKPDGSQLVFSGHNGQMIIGERHDSSAAAGTTISLRTYYVARDGVPVFAVCACA